MSSDLFFPRLTRRTSYRLTLKGTYYSDYNEYRQEIREDCQGRCVYCDCHENELAGREGMHLDHFRPKALSQFTHLANDPNNLVWSCARCNRLKSNHWPASGTSELCVDGKGFIEPFVEERKNYFRVEAEGTLLPLVDPARYMVELLGLNSHTPCRVRARRIEVAKQLDEMGGILSKYEHKHDLSDEEQCLLRTLSTNKSVLQKYLDFKVY